MIPIKTSGIWEKQLSRHKSYVYSVIFLSIFVAYLPVSPIVYMRTVFGPVINSQSTSFLLWLALVLVVALVLNGILEWIRSRVIAAGTLSFISTLEEKAFENTFEQENEKWGEGSQALTNLRILRNFMMSPISGAIFDAPFSFLLLVAIFFIHPLMGVFSLLGASLAFVTGYLIEKRVEPEYEAAGNIQSEARRKLSMFYMNPYLCSSMGNLPNIYNSWNTDQKKFLKHQTKASSFQSLGTSISQVVMMIQGSMLLGVGCFLTLIGAMSPNMAGNLIIAKFIGALAIRPMMMIVMSWSQVVTFRQALSDTKEFLKTSADVEKNSTSLPAPTGSLKVSGLSYKLDEKSGPILENFDFAIDKGNILAILGDSGAGKTTLVRLLIGITSPTTGSVRLDGVAIDKWSKKELSPHIGYVPQDIQLFGGSIIDNICRFQKVDTKKLTKACNYAGLDHILANEDPNQKLDLDEDSFTVSGGMKQKIALARALYGDPTYIVLDEPTSQMDTITENSFLNVVTSLREMGRLIIIVTHNQKILKMADYILAVKGGRQKLFDSKENIKAKLKIAI